MSAIFLVKFDANGKILQISSTNGYLPSELDGLIITESQYLELSLGIDNFYIEDDLIVPISAKPSEFYVFDYVTKEWVLDRELALSSNRAKRNLLLQESDWTQLPDVDLTSIQKAQWATYRQALRDMTEDDLINGNFPNKPY